MTEKKWKRLSRKKVFKSRMVQVYQDKVRLPNGATVNDYMVVEMPDYVKVVPIDRRGRILIMREYRHAIGDYIWETCSGFLDGNESPVTAAKRELAEETGYTKGNFKLLGEIRDAASTMSFTGYVVLATDIRERKKQMLENESITGIKFVSRKQLQRMVQRNEIVGSTTLAALALAGVLKP
jgi:ADP-ribose pyrophosphatase